MKTIDLKKSEHIHALVYGPSGGGKTTLLGMFSQLTGLGPMWMNDSDNGIHSIAGVPGIEYEQWYARPGEPTEAGNAWKKLMDFIDVAIAQPTFKVYAFDSLTTLTELVAAKVIGVKRDIIQFQEYTPIYALLTLFMVKIRRIKAHVFLTAHQEDIRDDRGKRLVQPLVLGKSFTPRVPVYWNNIWHLDVEPPPTEDAQPSRRLLVQKDGIHMAKTLGRQDQRFIEVTSDPKETLKNILHHITGEA